MDALKKKLKDRTAKHADEKEKADKLNQELER
jgi:hypothetical protein